MKCQKTNSATDTQVLWIMPKLIRKLMVRMMRWSLPYFFFIQSANYTYILYDHIILIDRSSWATFEMAIIFLVLFC